ncbi:MAG: tRNA pseudouridine(55) synthase TruB [Spirochaetaceae bacterium]|jgi:tRNA pseudouridine55 synthase|nr:tRNA pseudouridine(55) synthase TruB [Spirochaetaceae bacterium]
MRGTASNPAPSGLILLNKEPGETSFQSLGRVKKHLSTTKAGHTGTLDKFASGLLLVLAGRALKLAPWFSSRDKVYEAEVLFGEETDTLDPEGTVIARAAPPDQKNLEAVLSRFRGEIRQRPPAYSALHVGGKRAYELARAGAAVEPDERPVTVYALRLLSYENPVARIRVHCSSGTYIRSLARDIARAAGSRARLAALKRTRVAAFRLEDAVTITREGVITGNAGYGDAGNGEGTAQAGALMPINADIFSRLGIPAVETDGNTAARLLQGRPLAAFADTAFADTAFSDTAFADTAFADSGKTAAVFGPGGVFIALLERTAGGWKYGYVNTVPVNAGTANAASGGGA